MKTIAPTYIRLQPGLEQMTNLSREEKHQLLNKIVTMAEAVVTAYAEVEMPLLRTISGDTRNQYAKLLSRLVTVYTISADQTDVRELDSEVIAGGTFSDGGRKIVFKDGRESIGNLAITRPALRAAIEVLKSSRGT
jgi:hypothetical protein